MGIRSTNRAFEYGDRVVYGLHRVGKASLNPLVLIVGPAVDNGVHELGPDALDGLPRRDLVAYWLY